MSVVTLRYSLIFYSSVERQNAPFIKKKVHGGLAFFFSHSCQAFIFSHAAVSGGVGSSLFDSCRQVLWSSAAHSRLEPSAVVPTSRLTRSTEDETLG